MCNSFCKFKLKKFYMNRNMIFQYVFCYLIIVYFFIVFNVKMCYVIGRGIQFKGVRVNENVDFKVYIKGVGLVEVKVYIIGLGEILQLE